MADRRSELLELARAVAPNQVITWPAAWVLEALQPPEGPTATEDLLTVHQAAARLHVTPGYLYRRAKFLPFARKLSHKVLRFDSKGLEEWKATRPTRGHAA